MHALAAEREGRRGGRSNVQGSGHGEWALSAAWRQKHRAAQRSRRRGAKRGQSGSAYARRLWECLHSLAGVYRFSNDFARSARKPSQMSVAR